MRKFQVKEIAESRGITQEELTIRVRDQGVDVSLGTIQRIWQNSRRVGRPRGDTLIAIARVLGTSVEGLYIDGKESYNPINDKTPMPAPVVNPLG